MNGTVAKIRTWIILTVLLLGLPLVGTLSIGKPLSDFALYPPLTQRTEHLGFSWPAFVGLAAAIIIVFFPFEFRAFRWRSERQTKLNRQIGNHSGDKGAGKKRSNMSGYQGL